MVRTLDAGFQLLLDRLVVDDRESDATKAHRERIKECLDSAFGLYAFFRGGSFHNGTSVRGYSDLDYFASIEHDKMPDDSTLFLSEVGDALGKRFPNVSLALRAPAIVVPCAAASDAAISVIPAKLVGQTGDDHRIYEIVDGAGGWMKASPDAQSAYIAAIDARLDGKLKPLICLLKAWKYFRDVTISPFYLELRCTEYACGEKTIAYSFDLHNLFKLLWEHQLADIQDPQGILGRVSAWPAGADQETALSKLRTALYHSERAQEAAAKGKSEEAFRYWNSVFSGHFPAYG